MGAAKENRDRKHFRLQFDMEAAAKQSNSEMAVLAAYENERRRAEALTARLELLQAELHEARQALNLEMADHARTIQRAEEAARQSYEVNASLRRSYSEVSEALFRRKPLTKHEAMLLSCDDGFVLVHPGAGGLGAFATLNDARRWAAAHDGFIPQTQDHHPFYGSYHRVGFNIWPVRG